MLVMAMAIFIYFRLVISDSTLQSQSGSLATNRESLGFCNVGHIQLGLAHILLGAKLFSNPNVVPAVDIQQIVSGGKAL